MPWVIDQLAKEWDVIKSAPLSFGLALVLVTVLMYLLFRYWYKETLERQKIVITSLEKLISTQPLLPKESSAVDQERKQKIEKWRRLLYDAEKKYKSGKSGDDFVEILQRQVDYKSLGSYLSPEVKAKLEHARDTSQHITTDVSRNREGHRDIASLISDDITRIAQTWNLV